MKKIIYVFVLLIGIVLLTGCGEEKNIKTLKCTLNQKVNGQFGSMVTEETVTYNEDIQEFEKLHYRLNVDLTDEKAIEDSKKKEALASLKTSLEGVCEEALQKGADSCTVTTPREYSIEINSEGDVESGTIDQAVANYTTIEEMRTHFEGLHYTCKEE